MEFIFLARVRIENKLLHTEHRCAVSAIVSPRTRVHRTRLLVRGKDDDFYCRWAPRRLSFIVLISFMLWVQWVSCRWRNMDAIQFCTVFAKMFALTRCLDRLTLLGLAPSVIIAREQEPSVTKHNVSSFIPAAVMEKYGSPFRSYFVTAAHDSRAWPFRTAELSSSDDDV